MRIINLPIIPPQRPAWNKGRNVGQKRPLLPKHVWAIRVRLEIAETLLAPGDNAQSLIRPENSLFRSLFFPDLSN